VAEGAGLLNLYRGNSIEGSNPSRSVVSFLVLWAAALAATQRRALTLLQAVDDNRLLRCDRRPRKDCSGIKNNVNSKPANAKKMAMR
jgi:hypothetical protein